MLAFFSMSINKDAEPGGSLDAENGCGLDG
jgi:hypothetical protein